MILEIATLLSELGHSLMNYSHPNPAGHSRMVYAPHLLKLSLDEGLCINFLGRKTELHREDFERIIDEDRNELKLTKGKL